MYEHGWLYWSYSKLRTMCQGHPVFGTILNHENLQDLTVSSLFVGSQYNSYYYGIHITILSVNVDPVFIFNKLPVKLVKNEGKIWPRQDFAYKIAPFLSHYKLMQGCIIQQNVAGLTRKARKTVLALFLSWY